MAQDHGYRITYRSFNRSTRRMSGIHSDIVQAGTRWGALRAWWRTQRQFQPLVEVQDILLHHGGCPIVEYPTYQDYACGRH